MSAFPLRDGEEHRRLAQEYLEQPSAQEREQFFKEHATRYYELSRLPYFDAVRMTVIDPMHNILLGMVPNCFQAACLTTDSYISGIIKTQWLDAWIHTKTLRERTSGKRVPRELDQIHKYLKNVSTRCGKNCL